MLSDSLTYLRLLPLSCHACPVTCYPCAGVVQGVLSNRWDVRPRSHLVSMDPCCVLSSVIQAWFKVGVMDESRCSSALHKHAAAYQLEGQALPTTSSFSLRQKPQQPPPPVSYGRDNPACEVRKATDGGRRRADGRAVAAAAAEALRGWWYSSHKSGTGAVGADSAAPPATVAADAVPCGARLRGEPSRRPGGTGQAEGRTGREATAGQGGGSWD